MKYLVLKGCAGLGNRFITLMKAIQYAKLSHRKIYVDWCDGMFGPSGCNVFEEYFEFSYKNIASLSEIIDHFRNGATTYPSCIEEEDFNRPIYPQSNISSRFMVYTPKIANQTLYKVGLSIIPLHKLVYLLGLQSFQRIEKRKNLSWWNVVRTCCDGKNFPLGSNLWPWLKEDIVFFADFRPLISMRKFTKYIRLKEEYQNVIDLKSTEMKLDSAIGVHVRYTDKKPGKRLDNLVHALSERISTNKIKIFLCTDNLDIQEEFYKKFGDLVFTTEKYIPKCKEGIHIWASQQADGYLKKRMFEESLTDMWLLSKCKWLYWQGNSSFSYISSILKNDKGNCFDWMKIKY